MSVIEVSDVSKRFLLGSGSIKHALLDKQEKRKREFWALKDVSFKIEQGASVGIVGHNGSGKSTMLKLLTGIIAPTSGTIRTQGRIGALIEVGAGFHPDLTGRENIYLNGSILGLSRQEIARKFDDIVSFSGLERFIDTPVKRYSSGMYTRLGFSIASNVNPEILLVDEVLAVGDAQFQKKCLKRMKEFFKQGGTVVFVSHAMSSVADLCRECIWLDHGQILYRGQTREAIDRYMALVAQREEEELRRDHPEEWALIETERQSAEEANRRIIRERRQLRDQQPGDVPRSLIIGITVLDEHGKPQTCFQSGDPVRVRIEYLFARSLPNAAIVVRAFRNDNLHLFTTSNYHDGLSLEASSKSGTVQFEIPSLNLNQGNYYLDVRLFEDITQEDWIKYPKDEIEKAVEFEVVSPDRYPHTGYAYVPCRWQDIPSNLTISAVDRDRVVSR